VFDWEEECIYAGEQIDDGVQLCVQQSGDSVIAGLYRTVLRSPLLCTLTTFCRMDLVYPGNLRQK
jgi:hypothetical protein